MQTTLTVSKLQSRIIFTLMLPFQIVSATAAERPLSFELERKKTICVGEMKSKNTEKCNLVINFGALDKATKKILQRSDEVLPLFSQMRGSSHSLVLIARIHSKNPQSSGYCGSGYEDHVVLLEFDGKKISLQDDFLLQSCLKSITLDTDQGDDILKAISINREKHAISFRWLTNPDDKDHTLTVADRKFLLQ